MDINEYIKEKIKKKYNNKQNHFSNSTSSQKNRYISLNNINQIENRSQRFQNSYINNSSYTEYNKNRMNQFGNNSSINSYFYNKNKENKFSETSNYEKNSNFNTIDIPEIKKKENFYLYNINGQNKTNLSDCFKSLRVNRKIKTQSYKITNSNTNNNYSNNYYNNELEYMNIKLNLKVLEHKLSKLTNMLKDDEVFVPRAKRNISHLINHNIGNTNIIIDENGNIINNNRNKLIDLRNNQQNNYEININNNYEYNINDLNNINNLGYRNKGNKFGKENQLNNFNNNIINIGNNNDKMNNQNANYCIEQNNQNENNLIKENNYFQISNINQNNNINFIKEINSFQIVKRNQNYDSNKNNINKIENPLIQSNLNYKDLNGNFSEGFHNINDKKYTNINELNNKEPEGDKNKYNLNNNEIDHDNNNENIYNQNMINDYDINNNDNENGKLSRNNKKNNYKGMKISKDNIVNLLNDNSNNNKRNVNYKGEEKDDKIKIDKDNINDNLINKEKINEELLHSSRSNYDIEEDNKNNKMNDELNKDKEDNNINKNIINIRDENKNNDDYENNTNEINNNKENNNSNDMNEGMIDNNNKEGKIINLKKGKDEKPINYIMSQISPFKEDEQANHLIPEKESNYKKYLYHSPINKNQIKNVINNKNNIEYNFENEIEVGKDDENSKSNFTNKQIPEKDNKVKSNKKVSFDDRLIYINYDEDEYATNLFISDNNGKAIPYKEKDITKYLTLLTSISYASKIKPAMLNIEKKNKNKKQTKIMKRNIEYLKEVAKTGNVFSSAKDHHLHHKKNVEKSIDKNIEYYNTENIKNCRKFLENPQHFFTEELCDIVLQSYNLAPKENNSRSSSQNKNKSKSIDKK